MTGSMEAPPRGDPLGDESALPITGWWPRILLAIQSKVAVASLVCAAGILVGVALRLRQFLANRSLSQDEAMLALNVVHRPFPDLFRQLDFLQGAPAGFLALQRLAVDVFGNNEYSLRLVPFAGAIVALVLLFFLGRVAILPEGVPLAVVLFAVSDPIIYWSAHGKPYAIDVLAAVVVLWLGLRLLQPSAKTRDFVLFAIVGSIAIWISNPSVFVLAGVSTALVGGALVRRDRHKAMLLAATSGAWLGSFAVFALTLLHNYGSLQKIECPTCFAGSGTGTGSALSGNNLNSLRGSLGELRYAAGIPHFLDRGNNDAGLIIFVIAAIFCLIGLRSLARRRPEVAVALPLPLVFMLIAWGIHKYPTLGRTQLFLVPGFLLLFAEGLTYAFATSRRAFSRAAVVISGAAIAVSLAILSLGHAAHVTSVEDVRSVLGYLAGKQRPGDTLYVYYASEYQLRYYLECRCGGAVIERARSRGLWPLRPGPGGHDEFAPALLSVPPHLIVGRFRGRQASKYVSDLEALRGRQRVWFLLSSLETPRRALLLRALNDLGSRHASFSVGAGKDQAAVYLYDLRGGH
jgi:Dolichyl-phosphate-mannose-protein mannosyltransferase